MRRLLLLCTCVSVLALSGCLVKYSWEQGWHYNDNFVDDVFDAFDDRTGLEKQRDEFYSEVPPPHSFRNYPPPGVKGPKH